MEEIKKLMKIIKAEIILHGCVCEQNYVPIGSSGSLSLENAPCNVSKIIRRKILFRNILPTACI